LVAFLANTVRVGCLAVRVERTLSDEDVAVAVREGVPLVATQAKSIALVEGVALVVDCRASVGA